MTADVRGTPSPELGSAVGSSPPKQQQQRQRQQQQQQQRQQQQSPRELPAAAWQPIWQRGGSAGKPSGLHGGDARLVSDDHFAHSRLGAAGVVGPAAGGDGGEIEAQLARLAAERAALSRQMDELQHAVATATAVAAGGSTAAAATPSAGTLGVGGRINAAAAATIADIAAAAADATAALSPHEPRGASTPSPRPGWGARFQ